MCSDRSGLGAVATALAILAGVGIFWALILLVVLFHEGSALVAYAASKTSASQDLLTVVGFVASGLVGLATALAVERAKRPRLEILLTGSIEHDLENRKIRSVHLRVSHQGVAFFERFLLPAPALACVAKFRIIREDGSEVFPAPFEARWTGSQQPPEFRVADGGIYPSVFEMLKMRDVFPHTSELIDVCIKYEGDSECYVFNNSSYVKGYRSNDLRIAQGVYIVEASVSSGDLTVSKKVKLRNDVPRADFRIEPL